MSEKPKRIRHQGIKYELVPKKPTAPCVKAEGWLWDGIDSYRPVTNKEKVDALLQFASLGSWRNEAVAK